MASAQTSAQINAPIHKVWGLISDFNGLPKFAAALKSSTIQGQGIGAIRTLTLADGGEILEKLETQDNDAHTLSYTIITSPLPVANYLSTMKLSATGDAQCQLNWSSTFQPKGVTEDQAREIILGIYNSAIKGLQDHYAT